MSGDPLVPAGLGRRLAAMLYDALLLLAVLFFATLVVLAATGGRPIPDGSLPFMIYLLAVAWLFFAWFWTHGGQTLGMRAWRIRVQGEDGYALSWPMTLCRFCIALVSWLPAGLGYWWVLVDPQRRAWHDIACHGQVVQVPKRR